VHPLWPIVFALKLSASPYRSLGLASLPAEGLREHTFHADIRFTHTEMLFRLLRKRAVRPSPMKQFELRLRLSLNVLRRI